MDLARVRDMLARPAVTLLVDRWDEDWSRLGWVRIDGRAAIVEPGPGHAAAIDALRAKYPQYALATAAPVPARDAHRQRAIDDARADRSGVAIEADAALAPGADPLEASHAMPTRLAWA